MPVPRFCLKPSSTNTSQSCSKLNGMAFLPASKNHSITSTGTFQNWSGDTNIKTYNFDDIAEFCPEKIEYAHHELLSCTCHLTRQQHLDQIDHTFQYWLSVCQSFQSLSRNCPAGRTACCYGGTCHCQPFSCLPLYHGGHSIQPYHSQGGNPWEVHPLNPRILGHH